MLVCLSDTLTSIENWYNNHVLWFSLTQRLVKNTLIVGSVVSKLVNLLTWLICNFLYYNNNFPLFISVIRTFDCIWIQIKQDLLYSLHVWLYQISDLITFLKILIETVRIVESNHHGLYSNSFHLSFFVIRIHNFIDSCLYVEDVYIFCEVFGIFVQNRVIKNIMDKEIYEFGGRSHFLATILNWFVNIFKLFLNFQVFNFFNH